MSVDTSDSIIKSFKNFFLGTFFSRIAGFLRDIAMAFFFGASEHVAAFMVAYRFANLFRRLFGETSFQAGFVPYYENLRLENSKKASKFYRDLLFSMVFFIIIIVLISEISLFFVSKFIDNNKIISLTQIMIPGLIFICLYALNSSFLQCHKNYFLAAISPVSFNIIWIVSVIFFKNLIDEKFVYVLSFVVVLAFLFQYLTTIFSSFKIISRDLNVKEFLKPKIFTYEIKKLIKPISLSIIGIGAVQINSAFDSIFASISDKSGPAYLWYAIRLYQLPLALFGIALSSAILPPLTRAYKMVDYFNFKRFLNLGFSKSFALMMPCTVGMIILGPSLVNLIYKRGAFNQVDFVNTTYCLFGYVLSLNFATFVMIIVAAFWAKKEYFYPTISSILSVILNILLNSIFIFIFNMKSISVAIATSLSSVLNFYILLYFLKKFFLNLFQRNLIISFCKVMFCSLASAFITTTIGYLLKDQSIYFLLKQEVVLSTNFYIKLSSFFCLFIIYIFSLYGISYLTKTKEILDIIKRKLPIDKIGSDF